MNIIMFCDDGQKGISWWEKELNGKTQAGPEVRRHATRWNRAGWHTQWGADSLKRILGSIVRLAIMAATGNAFSLQRNLRFTKKTI